MSRLRRRDFHAIMEAVEQLYAYQTPDACEVGIVQSLLRVMDCDIVHLSEVQPKLRRVRWTSDQVSNGHAVVPNILEVIARHMHEHPFLKYWNPGRRVFKPVTLSDFVSRPSWHDTGLYNEIYRPVRMEHMLGVALRFVQSNDVDVEISCAFQVRDQELDVAHPGDVEVDAA